MRTRFSLKTAISALLALALVIIIAGCGSESTTDESSPGASGAPKPGGTARVGLPPCTANYDPATLSGAVQDIFLQKQVFNQLIHLGKDMKLEPVLATKWESKDNKVWKFTLQDGVKFTNGEAFTADDVVYTIDRLRSPKIGSSMKDMFKPIKSVVADDPTHVTITLSEANSEFPALLTPFPCAMLCKSVKEPRKEMVGTGPFMLKSFEPEDRVVLVKNPNYWNKDEEGNQLPYLDGLDLIFSTDVQGQLAGLQGGTLDYIAVTETELATLEGNPDVKVVGSATNYAYGLQIRTDQGPGKSKAFRQALQAGTDRQALVDAVMPNTGDPGNGTVIGPAYGSAYQEDGAKYDPTKAKELLAKAGFKNGTSIQVVSMQDTPWPTLVSAWKDQMKEIGVDVKIQVTPTDIFFGTDETNPLNWTQAEVSSAAWGGRANPLIYYQQIFVSGGLWNYARWSNPEFDALCREIPQTSDTAKRDELYKQAQDILIDEAPYVGFMNLTEGLAGQSSRLEGVTPAPGFHERPFERAYFTD